MGNPDEVWDALAHLHLAMEVNAPEDKIQRFFKKAASAAAYIIMDIVMPVSQLDDITWCMHHNILEEARDGYGLIKDIDAWYEMADVALGANIKPTQRHLDELYTDAENFESFYRHYPDWYRILYWGHE